MDQPTSGSELARLLRQIEEQNEAGRLGLYGPAVVATHASNIVRMQRGAERIVALLREGKREEADALLNSEFWEGKVAVLPTSDEAPPTA
jgi:hypothetical protein